jgi:hypothetical protein
MDICDLILDDHHEMRRLFGLLEQIDRTDIAALSAVWKRLRALLDTHAEAEERFFYPRLAKIGEGAGDAKGVTDEIEDAIDDHNDIRDAARAAERATVGSDAWFAAVEAASLANSKHMAEEERQGLTDFRRHASIEERHGLGVRFIAFDLEHADGVEPVNKDPAAYVEERRPAH